MIFMLSGMMPYIMAVRTASIDKIVKITSLSTYPPAFFTIVSLNSVCNRACIII